MRALFEMKPNFHKIFSDNPEDVLKRNLVDLERLRNLLSVMNEQQNKLDAAAKKMDGGRRVWNSVYVLRLSSDL